MVVGLLISISSIDSLVFQNFEIMKLLFTTFALMFTLHNSLSQVTTDTAYMRIAKKQFGSYLSKKIVADNKTFSLADTSNITCILPIYNVPMNNVDSITRQSVFANMIKVELNPQNQLFIIDNGKSVCMGYSEKGFAMEMAKNNVDHPSLSFLQSIDCRVFEYFGIGTIRSYKLFVNLLASHSNWTFFLIDNFEDLWAFDEKHCLLHIHQVRRKIIIEDGQLFYENMFDRIGAQAIYTRINTQL